MNSEVIDMEINSDTEHKAVSSEFSEYLTVETARKTEDEFIRTKEDSNYRIL
jgi:hypothetical protein